MANTYQSRNGNGVREIRGGFNNGQPIIDPQQNTNGNRQSSQNNRYAGTPALLAPDPNNDGALALVTLAVHQINDGSICVTNGNAFTEMVDESGEIQIDIIDASKGWQVLDAAEFAAAIGRATATYAIQVDCGYPFGVQDGRLVHLSAEDARTYGVDGTLVEHVAEDGNKYEIEGVIAVSNKAYIALHETANGVAVPNLTYTGRDPRTQDVFPFAEGLALAKKRHPMTDYTVRKKDGTQYTITAFPRGNQKTQVQTAKMQERIANSPLARRAVRPTAAPATPDNMPR